MPNDLISEYQVWVVALTLVGMAALLLHTLLAALFISHIRRVWYCLPQSARTFRLGLIYALLLPGVSYVIAWVVFPFSLPRALKKALKDKGSAGWMRCYSLKQYAIGGGVISILIPLLLWFLFHLSTSDILLHSYGLYYSIALLAIIIVVLGFWIGLWVAYWRSLTKARQLLQHKQ